MDWDSFMVGFALGIFVALALCFEKWLRMPSTTTIRLTSETGIAVLTMYKLARSLVLTTMIGMAENVRNAVDMPCLRRGIERRHFRKRRPLPADSGKGRCLAGAIAPGDARLSVTLSGWISQGAQLEEGAQAGV